MGRMERNASGAVTAPRKINPPTQIVIPGKLNYAPMFAFVSLKPFNGSTTGHFEERNNENPEGLYLLRSSGFFTAPDQRASFRMTLILMTKNLAYSRPLNERRPISRSMRFAIGGWVEKRLANISLPVNGCAMNKCAVVGEATSGRRFE